MHACRPTCTTGALQGQVGRIPVILHPGVPQPCFLYARPPEYPSYTRRSTRLTLARLTYLHDSAPHGQVRRLSLLLHPGVLERLGGAGAVLGVARQHMLKEVHSRAGQRGKLLHAEVV